MYLPNMLPRHTLHLISKIFAEIIQNKMKSKLSEHSDTGGELLSYWRRGGDREIRYFLVCSVTTLTLAKKH
jgi:hypothetical protein